MRNALIYVLFFLSGAAGLVYELVWVRELIFVFGGTTYAITTVLVAFMGGLGLGSYLAGRLSRRLKNPAGAYGLLEICIGLYALCVPVLLGLAEPAYRAIYPYAAQTPGLLTVFRFGVSAMILVIPTTFMGATLPILVRYVTLRGGTFGRSVGRLYGINTLGAVLGVVSAGFWLLPTLGLTGTTRLGATINIVIGIVARALLSRTFGADRRTKEAAGAVQAGDGGGIVTCPNTKCATPIQGSPKYCPRCGQVLPGPISVSGSLRWLLLVSFAASGFAAMVYQITWTRALVMSLGSSTYAFTCILAAFILGLALGSLAIARWVDRWRNPLLVFGVLELLIGLVAVVIVPIHGRVPYMAQALIRDYSENYSRLVSLQFLLVIAITFVPTFLMGAIFPLVARSLARTGDDPAAVTGRAYAVNTIGTITGSFLAGFVLIRSDVLGVQSSIVFASVLNGVIGVALMLAGRAGAGVSFGRRAAVPVVGLVLILLVGMGAGRWDQRLLNSAPYLKRGSIEDYIKTHDVIYYADGVDLTVGVMKASTDDDVMFLTVNGKPDVSTTYTDMTNMILMAHLPALLDKGGRNACIVGLGSGMTPGALSRYPWYERLDCIEISDEVIKAASYFNPYTYNILTDDPRVRVIRGDARNHLLLTDQRYDLISSEPSNPWLAGSSNLFTREFFELAKSRLTDDGIMAAWLHAYMMSPQDFQMVVRTLCDVFDFVSLWELTETDYALIASPHKPTIDLAEFYRRFETPSVWADAYRISVQRPAHVLGRYITSGETLRAWADPAPVHTDDNARLEFSAPAAMYLDQGPELVHAFFGLQRPVLSDLLAEADQPPPKDLQTDIENVVAARRARVVGGEAAREGDVAGALRVLLDGHYRDPANRDIWQYLVEAPQAIRQKYRTLDPASPINGMLNELKHLRPPLVAPLRGATLAQIAQMHLERANQASVQKNWAQAAEDLHAASRLEPQDRRTKLALADILAHLGQTDEAHAVLDSLPQEDPDGLLDYARAVVAARAGDVERALEHIRKALDTGKIPRHQIETYDAFEALRADPRFQTLIKEPETQPTAP